jgi:dTDP-4-dehydrorhamnose reductase
MKILVLGSSGMLGHKMVERLRLQYENVIGFSRENGLDVRDLIRTENMLRLAQPTVIINCVGVVKQREQNPEELIAVNALLPHVLQRVSLDIGSCFIHFSTDCVFSGKLGNYTHFDTPDPIDLYGRSKFLGEPVYSENTLVLRTSIVGREKSNYHGLLEWFLRQKGKVQGYENSIFSGVTTNWLSDVVGTLLTKKDMTGRWHVASAPISKLSLLQLFKEVYDRKDIEIVPTQCFPCDRSLDGDQFEQASNIVTPNWIDMLTTQYEQDKGNYAL